MPVPRDPVHFVKPGDPGAWPVCAGAEGHRLSSMGESCLGSLLGFPLHVKMLFALEGVSAVHPLTVLISAHPLSILLPCSKMGLRSARAATSYPQVYQSAHWYAGVASALLVF